MSTSLYIHLEPLTGGSKYGLTSVSLKQRLRQLRECRGYEFLQPYYDIFFLPHGIFAQHAEEFLHRVDGDTLDAFDDRGEVGARLSELGLIGKWDYSIWSPNEVLAQVLSYAWMKRVTCPSFNVQVKILDLRSQSEEKYQKWIDRDFKFSLTKWRITRAGRCRIYQHEKRKYHLNTWRKKR